jgi:hypothetical protein
MNVLAYLAKRTLIDRIDTLLASDTVQVSYAFPGDPQRLCVYGGALRFTQSDAVAESGTLSIEGDTIDVWVRCYQPGDDVRAADMAVEQLADQIIADLNANPKLVDPLSITNVALGDAGAPVVSPGPEPAVTSQLLLQVFCEGYV